jgi:hypothetical protein
MMASQVFPLANAHHGFFWPLSILVSTRLRNSSVVVASCSRNWLKNNRSRWETTSRASIFSDFTVPPGPLEGDRAASKAKYDSWHNVPYDRRAGESLGFDGESSYMPIIPGNAYRRQ